MTSGVGVLNSATRSTPETRPAGYVAGQIVTSSLIPRLEMKKPDLLFFRSGLFQLCRVLTAFARKIVRGIETNVAQIRAVLCSRSKAPRVGVRCGKSSCLGLVLAARQGCVPLYAGPRRKTEQSEGAGRAPRPGASPPTLRHSVTPRSAGCPAAVR